MTTIVSMVIFVMAVWFMWAPEDLGNHIGRMVKSYKKTLGDLS